MAASAVISGKPIRAYEFAEFRLDVVERVLLREGNPIPVPPKVLETLLLLVENRGHVVEKEAFLEKVWQGTFVEEGNLSQNIFALRKLLGEEHNGHRFIETVPRRGYRFVAPVEVVPSVPPTAAAPAAPSPRTRPKIAIGATVLLVLLATSGLLVRKRMTQPRPSPMRSVAVLPFHVLSSAEEDKYLAYGLADSLATSLAASGNLEVRPVPPLARYGGPNVTLSAAASELQADALIAGSVYRVGDHLRVTVQLWHAGDESIAWAQNFEAATTDLFALQDAINDGVSRAVSLGDRNRGSRPPVNLAAYRAYQQGRYFLNRRDPPSLNKAIAAFEQAIQSDPGYAPAYAGLADSWILLGPNDVLPAGQVYPKAKAAALRALELDGALADAHASLAFIALLYEWNWRESERHFAAALASDPRSPKAHHWYAYYLASQGRMDEALRHVLRAQELDPVSLIVSTDVAQILYFAGRFGEVVQQSRRTLDLDRNFAPVYWYLGLAYEESGNGEQAVAAYLRQQELAGKPEATISHLRQSFREGGMRGYWRALQGGNVRSAFSAAVIAARLGEDEKALRLLDQAYQEHHPSLVFLRVEPVFAGLRSRPGFADLVKRISDR